MPHVVSLLREVDLPTEDLAGITGLKTWVLHVGSSLGGVIALQRFGDEGLLRSLAVASQYRNHGLGRALVAQLERDAGRANVRRLVLLTLTAERFFSDLGYQRIERSQVCDEIKRSAQFRTLCPASAICMGKMLTAASAASSDG